MALFAAYYDAAGSFNPRYPNNSKYAVVVSGYVAPMHRWQKFDQRWTAVLADAGIRIPFHMSDFMAGQCGFEAWRGRSAEKAELLFVLARLIRRSVSVAIGEGVLIDEWKRANEVYALAKNHCTPYALAAYFVMDKTIRWIGRHPDEGIRTGIAFESGDYGKGDFMWVMDQIRRRKPALAPAYPQFADKASVIAFQACDFVAWEKRRAMGQQFCEAQECYEGWSRALTEISKLQKDWGYLDYDAMMDFCQRVDMPKVGDERSWAGVIRPARA